MPQGVADIDRIVVLVSRLTNEPVAYTDRDEWLDVIVKRCVDMGDYCVVYDGPPNWGEHDPN